MKIKFIRFFCLLTTIIFSFAQLGYADITSDNVFEIKDINVSYNSGNLQDSKQIAIDNGIMEALVKLVRTIAPTDMAHKIHQYSTNNPRNLIDEVTPTYERMTSHSYIGKVNITFNEQAVQNVLNNLGILYRKERAPKTLIIPIFHDETKYQDWNVESWKSAWENMQQHYGLLNLDLIGNSLEYVEYVDTDSALIDNAEHFAKVLDYYKAQNIIIIDAEQVENRMEVTLRFLGPNQDTIKYYIITRNLKEKRERLYKRLVRTLVEKFDNEWKGVESFPDHIMFTSKAKIMLHTPKTWAAMRRELEGISQLHDIKILKTDLKSMEVKMFYTLPPHTFSELLFRHGIIAKKKDTKLYLEFRK